MKKMYHSEGDRPGQRKKSGVRRKLTVPHTPASYLQSVLLLGEHFFLLCLVLVGGDNFVTEH